MEYKQYKPFSTRKGEWRDKNTSNPLFSYYFRQHLKQISHLPVPCSTKKNTQEQHKIYEGTLETEMKSVFISSLDNHSNLKYDF